MDEPHNFIKFMICASATLQLRWGVHQPLIIGAGERASQYFDNKEYVRFFFFFGLRLLCIYIKGLDLQLSQVRIAFKSACIPCVGQKPSRRYLGVRVLWLPSNPRYLAHISSQHFFSFSFLRGSNSAVHTPTLAR